MASQVPDIAQGVAKRKRQRATFTNMCKEKDDLSRITHPVSTIKIDAIISNKLFHQSGKDEEPERAMIEEYGTTAGPKVFEVADGKSSSLLTLEEENRTARSPSEMGAQTSNGAFCFRTTDVANVVFLEVLTASVCCVSTLQDLYKREDVEDATELEKLIVADIRASVAYAYKAFNITNEDGRRVLDSVCHHLGFDTGSLRQGLLVQTSKEHSQCAENRVNFMTRLCQDRIESIIEYHQNSSVLDASTFAHTKEDLTKRVNAVVSYYNHVVGDLEKGIQLTLHVPDNDMRSLFDTITNDIEDIAKDTIGRIKSASFSIGAANSASPNRRRRSSFCFCFGATVGDMTEDIRSPDAQPSIVPQVTEPGVTGEDGIALRFEVTAEKFELQTHADLEQVLSKYLLLLKVFTQHENRNMMTPEVSGDFTYNFDCVGEMVESMHFSNDSLSSTGSSDTMGVPNTCGFKYLATPGYFKDGHGQHALRSLPKQALRILHNYALYYGIEPFHEAIFRTFVLSQNFRGAMAVNFRPQSYLSEHIKSLFFAVALLAKFAEISRAFTKTELELVEQRIVITLESVIDSAIGDYRNQFPITDETGFETPARDDFEFILKLNSVLYRLMFFLRQYGHERPSINWADAAEDAMWEDIILKLKHAADAKYNALRDLVESNHSNKWEYLQTHQKSRFSRKTYSNWVSFRTEEVELLTRMHTMKTEGKIQLQNFLVDLKTFVATTVDPNDSRDAITTTIRGVINGKKAKPLDFSEWGPSYSVVVVDAEIPFSIYMDDHTGQILIDDASNVERPGGMKRKDHLMFIEKWSCVGKPLAAVFHKLASMSRPFTCTLRSAVSAGGSFQFSVTLKKVDNEGDKTIGLSVGWPKSGSESRVIGFVRGGNNDVILPAETCNEIRVNDLIYMINGVDVTPEAISHDEVLHLLHDDTNDTVSITLGRIVHPTKEESNSEQVGAFDGASLVVLIDSILEAVKSDEKYHARVVQHFVKNFTSLHTRRDNVSLSLVGVNLKFFYDLLIPDVRRFLKANPAGSDAKSCPEDFYSLYTALARFESWLQKWNGSSWKKQVNDYLDLRHSFGQYVVGWIEQSYARHTKETIPRILNSGGVRRDDQVSPYTPSNVWDMSAGEVFPWSTKELIILTNNMISSYMSLPNNEDISNVVRFGKQNICELFVFYADRVYEDFQTAVIRLIETQKKMAKTTEETRRLCARINAIFYCYDNMLEVLKGLNQIKSVDGFLDNEFSSSDSSDDEHTSNDLSRSSSPKTVVGHHSKSGNNWGDHFDDEVEVTKSLVIHRVRLRVCEARNLLKLDFAGFLPSDPYVQLRVYEQEARSECWYAEKQTKVKYASQNPCWEENFEFSVVRRDAKLVLRVLDHDTKARIHSEIGTLTLNLSDFFYPEGAQHSPAKWFPLQTRDKKAAGELKVLVVSRATSMGTNTIRRLNKVMDQMITGEQYGLVRTKSNQVTRMIRNLLFSTANPLPTNPTDIDELLVDERMDELYTFIGETTMAWCSSLHEICFARTLVGFWRLLMDVFIQFLLPTLDRAYPYASKMSMKRTRWSFFGSSNSSSLPDLDDRVERVTYLSDSQVELLKVAYRLILDYMGAEGSKSGLKTWLAERELGGEFLMLLELRENIETFPEMAISKVGKIMGRMIVAEENAKKAGWDSRYGREWESLRLTKEHLCHMMLFSAHVYNNTEAQSLLCSGLFLNDSRTKHPSDYVDDAW